jgi:hypothetical protein
MKHGRGSIGALVALALVTTGRLEAKDEATSKDLVPMEVVEAVMCKKVTKAGVELQAVEPTDQFSTSEKQVVNVVRFRHVLKVHTVKWRWYDPDGKLYVESADLPVTPTGKYHRLFCATHRILVSGERAMLHPGTWKAVVYLDGSPVSTSNFTLAASRSSP